MMQQFLEIFPKINQLLPKTIESIVRAGMFIVYAYHLFCGNIFFNTSFHEAQGIEKFANALLTPVQYLCEGKKVYYDETNHIYQLKQRFNYETNKVFYSPLSISLFSSSMIVGSVFKSIALLFPEVRKRHHALNVYLNSPTIISNNEYYRSMGIAVEDFRSAEMLDSFKHKRRPGDENNLKEDKEAFKDIVYLLAEKEIPFWVDCGTCLGTYRYGGVIPWDNDLDLSVIVNDFNNIRHALNGLDKTKYAVQDWSNRGRPEAYIRVYVKANQNHIDIYHCVIDEENQTLTNILAHDSNPFMADSWKIRERMFVKPIPFNVIFPLKKALFDGIEVPVPNQTPKYLTYKYGPNIEPVKIYSEETDQYEKDLSHPYWLIPLAH